MNLAEELAAASMNEEQIVYSIKKEIIDYFNDILASKRFESYLRDKIIGDRNLLQERKLSLHVIYLQVGCSDAYWSIGPFEWRNPENQQGIDSLRYKGVALRKLQEEIGFELSEMLISYLEVLGLKKTEQHRDKTRGYYTNVITIAW